MDSFELMLAIVFMAILFAVTPQGRDILRGLNKNSRVTKCSTNANTNVRITNATTGVVYKPISVLPIDDVEFQLEVETVERPHRIEVIASVIEKQLKHDVIKTLEEGTINYRLTKRELVNHDVEENAIENSKYTDSEVVKMSEMSNDERIVLEGEILNLKASKEEAISNAIENTVKLSSSKYNGGAK